MKCSCDSDAMPAGIFRNDQWMSFTEITNNCFILASSAQLFNIYNLHERVMP